MASKFKLSKETASALSELTSMLSGEIQDHRDNFDERSDAWQNGDAASEVTSWLDELESVLDALESVDNEPS